MSFRVLGQRDQADLADCADLFSKSHARTYGGVFSGEGLLNLGEKGLAGA